MNETLPFTTFDKTYRDGQTIPKHRHRHHQLIYCPNGALTVAFKNSVWINSPGLAFWAPAGTDHEIKMHTDVHFKSIYCFQSQFPDAPTDCCTVRVNPVLREMFLYAVDQQLDWREPTNQHFANALVGLIKKHDNFDICIALPTSTEARKIAERFIRDPLEMDSVQALAKQSGKSSRTIERQFLRETGMTFGKWRLAARMAIALRLLDRGQSVTHVSYSVGYESVSAFINVFKSRFRITPKEYKNRHRPELN